MKIRIPDCHVPLNHSQKRFYNALFSGASIVVALRFIISALFFHAHISYMGFYNLGAVFFSFGLLFIIRKGWLKLTFMIAVLEMMLGIYLANVYVGWETDFHMYIFIAIPLFFLYSQWKSYEYIIFVALMAGGYFFQYHNFQDYTPLLPPPENLIPTWSGINIILSFSASIAILIYYNFSMKHSDQQLEDAYQNLEARHEEKKVMLKEIHHRVKNNLHVVNGLLELQKHDVRNEQLLNVLRDTQRRIISIATIHEKMYGTEDLRYIELNEYFDKLIQDIIRTYTDRNIEFQFYSDPIKLDIDKLAPLAFLINEVVTNSIKYGISSVEKPIVSCKIKRSESDNHSIHIEIGDNGPGFDEHVFLEPTTFGMELIASFASDLNAEIQYVRDPGNSHYHLKLPIGELILA